MALVGVVVPVYFGEHTFAALHVELARVLTSVTDDWLVIYVDDGSPDGSWDLIAGAAAGDRRVRGVRLVRNFGEHVAITAGLDEVDADHVIVMACDLQDDPHAIPRLLEKAREGFDLVLARRLHRHDGLIKRALARLFYWFILMFVRVEYDHRVGNFRCVSRRAVDYFRLYRERLRNVNAIMAIMRLPTAYVDVEHRPRYAGRSTYSVFRSAQLGFHVLVGYSEVPLELVVLLGLGITVLSLGAVVAAMTGWVWSQAVQPLVIATSLLGALGGMMMLAIGTVGVYLTKTFVESMKRPMYFIQNRTPESDQRG